MFPSQPHRGSNSYMLGKLSIIELHHKFFVKFYLKHGFSMKPKLALNSWVSCLTLLSSGDYRLVPPYLAIKCIFNSEMSLSGWNPPNRRVSVLSTITVLDIRKRKKKLMNACLLGAWNLLGQQASQQQAVKSWFKGLRSNCMVRWGRKEGLVSSGGKGTREKMKRIHVVDDGWVEWGRAKEHGKR
jgi:hypothetical protein